MPKYFISYSSLNWDSPNYEVKDFDNQQQADSYAYEMAVEDSYYYEGSHGYLDPEDYAGTEEEIDQAIEEDRQNLIEYTAELYSSEKHDDYL